MRSVCSVAAALDAAHPPQLLKTPAASCIFTHLHGVASQGGGPFKPPALLLGHHEQLGQALLHDPGEALVVQTHQRIVHALQDCGCRRKTGCSEDRPSAGSEPQPPPTLQHQPWALLHGRARPASSPFTLTAAPGVRDHSPHVIDAEKDKR